MHSEADVEAVSEVVVKRGRGRPRKAILPKEKKRGRPRKDKPPKEKKPIGRPRKIRDLPKKPPRRPKTWTEEHMADKPKYKPKDPDY